MVLDDCEDENDDNDIYIYNNDDVPDHDYRVKDGSLTVRAQVRENSPRSMGDQTDGYRKAENTAPTITVMTTTISTKVADHRRAAPTAPQRDLALFGSRKTAPQISIPNNYVILMCLSCRHHRRIRQGRETAKGPMGHPHRQWRTSAAAAANSPKNVTAETPAAYMFGVVLR